MAMKVLYFFIAWILSAITAALILFVAVMIHILVMRDHDPQWLLPIFTFSGLAFIVGYYDLKLWDKVCD